MFSDCFQLEGIDTNGRLVSVQPVSKGVDVLLQGPEMLIMRKKDLEVRLFIY